MIPKIIHRQAPSNTKNWHPVWNICYGSWFNKFHDFEFQMWDEDRCDTFVKDKYPDNFLAYIRQRHIVRIDIVRYMFMYEYGGIYVDMDMYCYDNFYNKISNELYLVESLARDEIVTNCIIIAKPKHIFFRKCLTEIFNRLNNLEYVYPNPDYKVKYLAGPYLLSDMYRYESQYYGIDILSANQFIDSENKNITSYTKHLLTGIWGKEDFNNILQLKVEDGYSDLTDKEYIMLLYNNRLQNNL